MILDKFPKTRTKLPEEYQLIYEKHYLKNREGKTKVTSISSKLESWMHKKVSQNIKNSNQQNTILEIGAGTLNHLPYENNTAVYDIIEPFKELYANSIHRNRIRNIFNDIKEVDNFKYDQIISIATFEHIINLPEVVSKAALLLNKNGKLLISIPNEGTILWRLGTMFTGFEFQKMYGLDYKVLMAYEHVNTASEIEEVLKYYFKEVKGKSFGLSKKFAFYRFFNCSQPNLEKAKSYFNK